MEENGELKVTFTINRGRLFRVARCEITGTSSIPIAEFRAALRVRDGQPYSSSLLDADVSLIRDLYRRRGFASADVVRAVEPAPNAPDVGEVPVIARIAVTEGVPTIVDAVTFSGNEAIDQASLRARLPPVRGRAVRAWDSSPWTATRCSWRIRTSATKTPPSTRRRSSSENNTQGHHSVRHSRRTAGAGRPRVDRGQRPHRDLHDRTRAAGSAGKPFGLSAINESQRRLSGLGLFRRVRISELRHGDETGRDLLVTVDEAPPTTVGVGGGLEARMVPVVAPSGAATDELDLAPRVFFQIGRRNLFGRNRSANLFASLSLHSAALDRRQRHGIPRRRHVSRAAPLRHGLRCVRQRHGRTAGSIHLQLQAHQRERAVIARHLTRGVSVTGNYQIQRTKIFDARVAAADLPLIDRTFTQFLLSSVSASLIRDTRDDPVRPRIRRLHQQQRSAGR